MYQVTFYDALSSMVTLIVDTIEAVNIIVGSKANVMIVNTVDKTWIDGCAGEFLNEGVWLPLQPDVNEVALAQLEDIGLVR
jgi:hypothetical protein